MEIPPGMAGFSAQGHKAEIKVLAGLSSPLEALGRSWFQVHTSYWQEAVPRGCRTEGPANRGSAQLLEAAHILRQYGPLHLPGQRGAVKCLLVPQISISLVSS